MYRLSDFVSLVGSMRLMWSYMLNYIFALAFVATVPVIIRSLWRR